MAGRNRLPTHALKGGLQAMPQMHESPYAMGGGPLPPHPALVEEMRNDPYGRGPGTMLPHPDEMRNDPHGRGPGHMLPHPDEMRNDPHGRGPGHMLPHPDDMRNDPHGRGPGPMLPHPDDMRSDPHGRGPGPMLPHPDDMRNDPHGRGPGPMHPHPDEMRNDPHGRGPGPMHPHPDEMRNDPHGRGPGPMLPHPDEMRNTPHGRGPGPMLPYPDEMRNGPHGRGPGPMLPHPALVEERLAAQNQEIQGMLVDNQRLAATHVALRQELASVHQELQHLSHVAHNMQADRDQQLRGLYDNSTKLEAEMRAIEPMKAELVQLHAENQKMGSVRQELTSQVQTLTQELARSRADMQQSVPLRTEIESLHEELQRARAAIEYEKKSRASRLEQGRAMEKNFISLAREVEKLRAELIVDKRERGAANPGGAYGGNYGSAEMGYPSGAYGGDGDGYGMHPVQAAEEGGGQYGAGAAAWGAYEMQHSHPFRLLGDWKEQEQDLQFIADLQQAQKKEGPKVKGGLKDGGMYGGKGSKEFKTVGVGFNKMHSVIEDITMNRGVSRFVRFAGQNIVFEVLGAVKFSVAIYTFFVCQYVGEHGDSSKGNFIISFLTTLQV